MKTEKTIPQEIAENYKLGLIDELTLLMQFEEFLMHYGAGKCLRDKMCKCVEPLALSIIEMIENGNSAMQQIENL